MLLLRSLVVCALLCGFCFSEVMAQQRLSSFFEQSLAAPVLHARSTLSSSPGTKEGAIWSGAGATAGSLLGYPVFGFLAMGLCDWTESESKCALSLLPFGVGAAVGASLGAQTGGDRPAWATTLIGAAVGTAATVILAIPYSQRDAQNRSRAIELVSVRKLKK
jgi:hypothetical protein